VVDLALSSENTDHSNSDYAGRSDTNVRGKYSRHYDRSDNNVHTKGNGNKIASRIFVVDDDPDIVYVLKKGLLKNGFSVEGFTSSEEALLRFRSNGHDFFLVVSDIRMPGLSGLQLARKVKEINPDVKIVLMTSFEVKESEFSKVFPSTHIDAFIQKPIKIADLTNRILSLIREPWRKLSEG
jgi:CheY-like chemotaxis protein